MSSLLDADMATLGRAARGFYAWWIEELAAMIPARVRHWTRPRPAAIARFDGTDFAYTPRRPRGSRPRVAVALPAAAVLRRDLRLPALGSADLRRMIELDADRLLPFPAGTALLDVATGSVTDDGLAAVVVAALPLDRARAVMAAADAAGIAVGRLAIAAPDGLEFDFAPAWRATHDAPGVRHGRFWWGVVAVLFALDTGTLIGRDVQQLHATQALVDAHGEAAAAARRVRGRLLATDAARRSAVDRRSRHDPLRLLAELTRIVPDGAWVQRLTWDGRQLRLIGFKPAAVDVVAALRKLPRFAAVRPSGTEVAAATATGEPFDVTAETAPEPSR